MAGEVVEAIAQILAVDIGGSGIKVMVLDRAGTPQTERARVSTPQPPKPEAVLEAIASLSAGKTFDAVSVGFPGVVREGKTETAVNLDPDWIGFDLAAALSEKLGKPVRVINDADIQGLGAIAGQGVELVITLGTGFGSALFLQGQLVPNLELGHHLFRGDETYEEQLGREALDRVGKKRWNRRLEKAIATLRRLFNFDMLYIGGGNTDRITFDLPLDVKIVPNVSGLLGGIALWRHELGQSVAEVTPIKTTSPESTEEVVTPIQVAVAEGMQSEGGSTESQLAEIETTEEKSDEKNEAKKLTESSKSGKKNRKKR